MSDTVFGIQHWTGQIDCPRGVETTRTFEVPRAQIPSNAVALVGITGWTYHTDAVHYLIMDFFHNGGTEHWLAPRMEVLEGKRTAVTDQPATWVPFMFPDPGHHFTGGGADRLYVKIRAQAPLDRAGQYQVLVGWIIRVAD